MAPTATATAGAETKTAAAAGGLRGQEQRGVANVFGLTPAVGRRSRHHQVVEGVAALADRRRLVGGDVARADAVHLDVVLRPFAAHVVGQQLETALGGGVG